MSSVLSENRRIIAIGDVHGCLCSLKELLARIDPDPQDQLVFLGDMIDRGACSKEVVEYLFELDSLFSCFFLMGNHEQMFLDYLDTRYSDMWFFGGGKATLRSYNSPDGFDLPLEHLEFFRGCSYFIETENFFFTHGGLDPELSIRDNLRYCKPVEFCWQRAHMRSSFLERNAYNWQKTVVCAHTPVSEPVLLDRLIAIDTGCVYTDNPLLGKLTAVILPERRIVQVSNCD